MSRTPSENCSTATVLELGNRRALEVSRTVPASTAIRFATGTSPSGGLDAHLIAIGTPSPGSVQAPISGAIEPKTIEPKTVFLGQGPYVRPSRAATPSRPRASIAVAVLLGILSLAIAPLAPLAWMHATDQLDRIARGTCSTAGERTLHVVNGIGIAMTMLAVAATAFGFTVVVARALT